jgi:hypothetical protein
MKPGNHSLDRLELDVLARITRHREDQNDPGTLPAGLTLAVAALSVGMLIGWSQSQRAVSDPASERIVLADEARLAPSTLLAGVP